MRRPTLAGPVLLIVFLSYPAQGQQPDSAERRAAECLSRSELLTRDESLAHIDLNLRLVSDRHPVDCSVGLFETNGRLPYPDRRVADLEFYWAASELYHQPLYFDDTLLERYGQTRHPLVQPFASGAHFFLTFPIVPYKMGLDRPHDHIYTLGYYRPGSPNPCLARRLPPLEADATLLETATWMAFVFVLP